MLCTGASCSTGDIHSCDNVNWYNAARAGLTGAPQFSSPLIAPGEPLALAVPVDERARFVEVRIRRVVDADAGPSPIVILTAETDGAETVQLPLEDTDLAYGLYSAESIVVAWEEYDETRHLYASSDVEMPYVVRWIYHFEQPEYRCQSEIPVPTFEVVGSSE